MRFVTLVAALAAAPLVTPAVQAQQVVARTQRVSTASLDLSAPADVARLDRRIARAAREVCHDPAQGLDLSARMTALQCRAAARAAATEQRDRAVAAATFSGSATRTASR